MIWQSLVCLLTAVLILAGPGLGSVRIEHVEQGALRPWPAGRLLSLDNQALAPSGAFDGSRPPGLVRQEINDLRDACTLRGTPPPWVPILDEIESFMPGELLG